MHVATAAQNKADGFSPGSLIMTYVPNLEHREVEASRRRPTSAHSLKSGAPIVHPRHGTHRKRIPYFAELDAQTTNTAEQLLLIHPAVALTEGHRYAVVLRNLCTTTGAPIAPLASTIAALAGTLKPKSRGAHIRYVIRHDFGDVLGGPRRTRRGTSPSRASRAWPARHSRCAR